MFISIVLLFTFPSWHEEVGDDGSTQDVKQLPPPIVLTILNGLALPTSVCALLATTLAHSALMGYAAALRITVPTEVEAQLGVANLVLSWAGSLLCALAFTVIFVQDLSIKVLRETISSEDLAAQTPSAAQVRFDDLDE
ncbi:hypothetical protein MMC10_002637 [Thelotrema lepadinum]|nr:hypothetical protein [Thelotrema lepadinum]